MATKQQNRTVPATPTMQTAVEVIDRAKALEYLEHNTGNRPIDKGHVRELARDIEQGRWHLTHQGVAFDVNGVLRDGQHRLMAIVHADRPVPIQVTRNLTEDALEAIDQHRRRTAAQLLAMRDIRTDAPRLAAMARTILNVVHGESKVSNGEAVDYAVKHAETLKRYVRIAQHGYTPAVAAAFAWADMLGWGEVQTAAQRLVEGLFDGPHDPMRALWTRSKGFKRELGPAGIKRKFDIALSCLQAVHEGREMTQARTIQPDYQALERASQRPTAR